MTELATRNHIARFAQAIEASGMQPPSVILDDGKLHRFSPSGKPQDDAGWYVLHDDGIPAGAFGDWRTGHQENWCAKAQSDMTEAERQALRERIKAAKARHEAEQRASQEEAAVAALARWNAARPALGDHPYLVRKGVSAHGLRVEMELLMVPMRDSSGAVRNIQTIDAQGRKLNMPGGQKQGLYHSIGRPNGVIVIAEGYATAASVFEATGHAAACAFGADNVPYVAKVLREHHPDTRLVFAADDDPPGRTAADAAARALGGVVVVPDFGADRPTGASDFNDMHKLCGGDSVCACIERGLAEASPAAGRWPEAQPLLASFDRQPYPVDALPDGVRAAVDEVAAFVKAPVPMIAMSALSALSLAIQTHHDVERAAKLDGPCSLFVLAIADSGERKSTVDGFFTKAIRDHERQQQDDAEPKLTVYRTSLEIWEAQRTALKEKIKMLAKEGKASSTQENELHALDKVKPVAPRVPRLTYGDTTPEALAYSLAHQWPSGGVVSNEAGTVFGSHGMQPDSVMRNLAMLNQFWEGAELPVDRRSSESFTVRGARLTMWLQVQEATLRQFFASTRGLARGSGFLARFLIAWPESSMGTRMFTEAPENWPALAAFHTRLATLLDRPAPINDKGALAPAMLKLSPDAQRVWVTFHDKIEAMLGTGGELYDVRDVASKTADNAVRLAAMFHVFEGKPGPIGAEAMESGARIAAWHLSEARRFLGELALPADMANPLRLEAWLLDYCKREQTDKVPTREVLRCGPGALRGKTALSLAMEELEKLGHIRLIQDGKKKLMEINPALLAGASQ